MKKNFIILLFTLSSLIGFSLADDLQCFVSGECINSQFVGSFKAEDEYECLNFCKSDSNCAWFTYFPSSNFCNLYANCNAIDEESCPQCVSGEQACLPEPICWVTGKCLGNLQQTEEHIESKEECLRLCKNSEGCNWFTHIQSSSICFLFTDCQTLDESCGDCTSGESRCKDEEPAWHMLIGGNGYQEGTTLESVELFNWQTGEQCEVRPFYPKICAHVGTVLEGVPLFCGGYRFGEGLDECYKLNKTTMFWERILNLLGTTYYASGVNVPNQGWVIFGGATDLPFYNAQQLKSVDGYWEKGPELYLSESDFNHCVVQLNDTTTGIFGGSQHPKRIVTLDWTTMEYTEHKTQLIGSRSSSACALLIGPNGETLVALAGGVSPGLEVWNPQTDKVTMLTAEFPTRSRYEGMTPFMISVNGASELIYYQEVEDENRSRIWRYNQVNNSWSQIGNLLIARKNFVALPVSDIACPTKH